jgi:hypothetical protein
VCHERDGVARQRVTIDGGFYGDAASRLPPNWPAPASGQIIISRSEYRWI